jgi:DNA repair protein RecO (recombination protein O)
VSRARAYRTDAIVLRTVDFAETSQVVHLGTPDHGLVPAIAKGSRNPKGSFQGGLSMATCGEAALLSRAGAELELLRSFRMTDGLRGLREDLSRFAAGEYVVGLLRSFMRPGLANPALFLAGATALRALSLAPPPAVPVWVVVFEARALDACGHRPHLGSCVACGGVPAAEMRFDPSLGGIVHPRCARGGATRRVTAADLAVLRRLYTARLAELASEPPAPRDVAFARAVHDLFLPYVLEREPAALRALPR